MEYPLYNQQAENIGKVELPDGIFNVPSNNDLLHQVALSLMANKRQVIAHAKTRSEVRGGGKKPWRQKGTGRARHGSTRSPIWKGGGAAFGPTKDIVFKKKIGKKMARKALVVALSEKARSSGMILVDNIGLNVPKTKEIAGMLRVFKEKLDKTGSVLFVTPSTDKNLYRATKNIQKTGVIEAKNLNSLEILSYKNLILLQDSVNEITKMKKS